MNGLLKIQSLELMRTDIKYINFADISPEQLLVRIKGKTRLRPGTLNRDFLGIYSKYLYMFPRF